MNILSYYGTHIIIVLAFRKTGNFYYFIFLMHMLHLQFFPDRFVQKEISKLIVICPFSEDGCDWEGKYEGYQSHANSCDFASVKCDYCGEKSSKNSYQVHLQLCSFVPKDCPVAVLGCSKLRMTNEALNKHLQEHACEHLALMVNRIQSIEGVIGLRREKEEFTSTRGRYYNKERKGLRAGEWNPDCIEADRAGTTCSHTISKSKTQFVARLQDMDSSEAMEMRVEKFMRTELESLLLSNVAEVQKELLLKLTTELKAKDDEITSLQTKVAKLEKTIKVKNAEHEDRDFRLSLIENSNHDGSMIWKIPQFTQRKSDAENGKYTSIFSLPFYTGRYGFKMCLRLYIMGDGIGKGTHLSLFFVVMRGEFDNILQWPFTHKVTFKLINQAGGHDIVDTFRPDPMSSSFRKPKSDMNIASGCPRFVSHTELERGGFIVDDTIFIKCTIDVATIRHP